MTKCECGGRLVLRGAVSTEPHGETFNDEWYACVECDATYTVSEVEVEA